MASNGHALTYVAVTQPAHGTLILTASTGAFTYTPASGYTGSDSFTSNANDGTATSNNATVSIKVNAVPVTPPPPLSGGSSGGGGAFGLLSLLLLAPLVRLKKKKPEECHLDAILMNRGYKPLLQIKSSRDKRKNRGLEAVPAG